jgi:Taurine catabolism dioxygenase TauD, TfdA family
MDDPINVAYSNLGLDLHIDLAYYESPPGLQLLHCLQFDDDVVGGLSQLLDGYRVAEVRSYSKRVSVLHDGAVTVRRHAVSESNKL